MVITYSIQNKSYNNSEKRYLKLDFVVYSIQNKSYNNPLSKGGLENLSCLLYTK